jgi:hypothetical protein
MSRQDLVRSLAKTAAATAFGGPIAGAGAGVNEAIDLMAGWLGRREKNGFAATIERVGRDLERFAASERLDEAIAVQAMTAAESVISRHGATVAEMNRLGLDAGRVSAVVLRRGGNEIRYLDEGARELCRAAVSATYDSLLVDASALPGLEIAFKRAVLDHLDLLPGLPQAVADAVESAAASAVVTDPSRVWRPDLFAPSALLRAEYGIVPFQGRESELADLDSWCADERPIGVRLYTGAGGIGKTRLMLEVLGRAAEAGWRAGFVTRDAVTQSGLRRLVRDTPELLLIVDYAETRRSDVQAMIKAALDGGGGKVRLVLLARARADWWRDLLAHGDRVGDLLEGPATSVLELGPVAREAGERRAAFESATKSFAAALRRPLPGALAPALEREAFERVLFIHLKALAAVEGELSADEDAEEQALLAYALKRERRFWDDGARAAGLDSLAGSPIAQAAAVVTLAGEATDHAGAIRLLSGVPLLADQPVAVIEGVAELLHRLYPGEYWLQGVQPDLLGEHLVGEAADEDLRILGVFAGAD